MQAECDTRRRVFAFRHIATGQIFKATHIGRHHALVQLCHRFEPKAEACEFEFVWEDTEERYYGKR